MAKRARIRAALLSVARNLAPVPYAPKSQRIVTIGGTGYGMTNTPADQMRAFGSNGTLFAIVSRLANSTASARWRLYRSAASGHDEDRTEVTRHAALDVWRKPNPFMTQQEFVETFQQHKELTGEAWWLPARISGLAFPTELWPVRPDRMSPMPDPIDFLKGYEYLGPEGERIPLGLDEAIFLRSPNPLDIYRGMGPVQTLLADLDSAKYSAEWNRQFFLNSAEPGGIIEVDEILSDEQFNEMTDRWREQHQGVQNAHRVAVIERGRWVDRKNFSQREMQFAELQEVSDEKIRKAFGFPKPLLGSVDDVNRANAEAAEVVFARWLIRPRLDVIKQALNNDFLPMFGTAAQGLEFDYDEIVPEDKVAANAELTAKANAAKIFIELGFVPASVLEVLELPEMEFEKPEPPPAPIIAPPAPAEDPATEPDAPAEEDAPADPVVPEPDGEPANHAPRIRMSSDDVDISKVQTVWETAVAKTLRAWGGVQREQIQALADQITEIIEHGDLASLATLQTPTAEGSKLLAEAMAAIASVSAQQVVGEAKKQKTDVKPAVPTHSDIEAQAGAVAALLGAGLALSAGREALRVHRSEPNGKAVAEHVANTLHALSDAQPREAIGGALTGAQNAARFHTLLAAPVAALYASEKNDKNTCKNCKEIDGRWLGNSDGVDFETLNKTYPSSGYVDCLGRDRCRGTVVGVWRPVKSKDGGNE